ncbi:MAG: aminoacetone oxidase family FAD-binding enzyme [Anaerovoracaceae bacterium]
MIKKGMKMYDICIIGGGASGMVAAISAAMESQDLRICIIEKKERLGKKLAATGNGRCNITNLKCDRAGDVMDFFHRIGVAIDEEKDGWMYPLSRQAEDVVMALTAALEQYNINVIVNKNVDKVTKERNWFNINDETEARILLLATGGKAGPQYGTVGDGYKLARSMGHSVTKLAPVLTALESHGTQGLKGVRARGKVSLSCKGKMIAEESGEIQFTADGVSGICIFNLSRFVRLDKETDFSDYRLHMDFLPLKSQKEVEELLMDRATRGLDLLRSILPAKLSEKISKEVSTPGEAAEKLKDFSLKITGASGWNRAQCTSGGVEGSEIDGETLESKLVEGLFFAGEILDYDGPCGGYNLQNAWETGMKAGREMARRK